MSAAVIRTIRTTVVHDMDLDRIDLAGYNQTQATELVNQAFKEPIPAREPLRFQFVVGGGKLVRSKYAEDLPKWLSAALREIGYAEDRSAAVGDAGVFKQQHDLGQNLMYLTVFPKIAPVVDAGASAAAQGGAGAASGGAGGGGRREPESVDSRVVTCTLDELKKMVAARMPAWSQKRRAAGVLSDAVKRLDALDAKLVSGQQLSGEEQEDYDRVGRELLDDKAAWLKTAVQAQVAEGVLTAAEKDSIAAEMRSKLEALDKELAAATAGGSAKKAEALRSQRETLATKKAHVDSVSPVVHPLRGELEIRKTKQLIGALERLEASIGGRMKSLAEVKELGQLPDLQARLEVLLKDARDFFESDEEFKVRLQAATAGKGGGGGGGGGKGGKGR